MRKVIAVMNMTIDGYCNHEAGVITDELHEYYNELMKNIGTLVYGRTTYQLMEDAFPPLAENPGDDKIINEFAVLIDNIPKLVFSKTLQTVNWKNTTLVHGGIEEEILKLKQQPGKDIAVGSPSLIAQLTQLGLIDEYRLCIHPIISGSGLVLFKNIDDRIDLKLIKTQTFESGVVALWYQR
jgi:dihydrofolate reductase